MFSTGKYDLASILFLEEQSVLNFTCAKFKQQNLISFINLIMMEMQDNNFQSVFQNTTTA